MTKYIYITSSGHSGSTLLDLILGAHSQAFSIGEIKQWDRYIQENLNCSCGRLVIECPFWQAVKTEVFNKTGKDIFKVPAEFVFGFGKQRDELSKFKKWLILRNKTSANGLFKVFLPILKNEKKIADNRLLFYDAVRKVSESNIVIDSSKSSLIMKWLWMQKPEEVKIIHLVRDGRGFLRSALKKHKDLKSSIANWVTKFRLTRKLVSNMNKASHILVKYEDVCANPEKEIKRICSFLQIPFEDEMLHFRTREKHNIDGNRMRFTANNIIRLDESWKTELSPEILKAFESKAGALNRELGYQ